MISPAKFCSMRCAKAQELEDQLDYAIREAAFNSQPGVKFSMRGWPVDVVDHVLRCYRYAGWTVHIVTDKKNGDFIQLEVP